MQELYNFSFHYIVLVLLFLAVGFTIIGSCLICCIYCVQGQGIRLRDMYLKLHLEGTRAKDMSVLG